MDVWEGMKGGEGVMDVGVLEDELDGFAGKERDGENSSGSSSSRLRIASRERADIQGGGMMFARRWR